MTFVKDPCGVVCVLVTYLAVLYADYVVTRWIILQTMHDRYILPHTKKNYSQSTHTLTKSRSIVAFQHLGSRARCRLQYDRLPAGHVPSEGGALRSRYGAIVAESSGLLRSARQQWSPATAAAEQQQRSGRMDGVHTLRNLSAAARPSLSHL